MFQWVTRRLFGRHGDAKMPRHRELPIVQPSGAGGPRVTGARRGITKTPMALVKARNRRNNRIARHARAVNRA